MRGWWWVVVAVAAWSFAASIVSAGTMDPPRVTAKSAIVVDAHTGSVLWSQDPDEQLPPASTTKVMTAILALQSGRLSARGLHRVRRVARTVADLHGGGPILSAAHVATALSLRIDTLAGAEPRPLSA